jgi:hypothetical protein
MNLLALVDVNSIIADPYHTPTGNGFWDLAGYSGIAMIASATLLSFLYVWGTLFRNQGTIVYVKSEFYEMLVTVFLLIFIFGAIGSLTTLKIASFLPASMLPSSVSPDMNVFEATADFYTGATHVVSGWLTMNYVFSMYVDQMASITPYARPLGVGLVASPMAGFASPIKQVLYNMSVALSVSYVVVQAQLVVYIFSLQAFLKYYLPFGIFLRSFTPTRRLGGTLIGTAVAFIFVFPAITLITYSMFFSQGGPILTFNSMATQYLTDAIGGSSPGDSILGRMSNFFTHNFSGGFVDIILNSFGSIGGLFENIVGTAFLTLLIIPIGTVSFAFAIAFLSPAFNLIIFTQAAKGLSKSFGEEVDISSLTRMI